MTPLLGCFLLFLALDRSRSVKLRCCARQFREEERCPLRLLRCLLGLVPQLCSASEVSRIIDVKSRIHTLIVSKFSSVCHLERGMAESEMRPSSSWSAFEGPVCRLSIATSSSVKSCSSSSPKTDGRAILGSSSSFLKLRSETSRNCARLALFSAASAD